MQCEPNSDEVMYSFQHYFKEYLMMWSIKYSILLTLFLIDLIFPYKIIIIFI